jgi:hypothetical protein
MQNVCNDFKSGQKKSCEGEANFFYMAVKGFGCPAFVDSQKLACLCQPNDGNQADTVDPQQYSKSKANKSNRGNGSHNDL